MHVYIVLSSAGNYKEKEALFLSGKKKKKVFLLMVEDKQMCKNKQLSQTLTELPKVYFKESNSLRNVQRVQKGRKMVLLK